MQLFHLALYVIDRCLFLFKLSYNGTFLGSAGLLMMSNHVMNKPTQHTHDVYNFCILDVVSADSLEEKADRPQQPVCSMANFLPALEKAGVHNSHNECLCFFIKFLIFTKGH
jgi:hypothetical protein